jgi:hypothetical protein
MVMNEIGPFIPFGAPNEAVPEVGAACLYAAESEWQNAVQYLLGRARLVVLRIGRTEGFWLGANEHRQLSETARGAPAHSSRRAVVRGLSAELARFAALRSAAAHGLELSQAGARQLDGSPFL